MQLKVTQNNLLCYLSYLKDREHQNNNYYFKAIDY